MTIKSIKESKAQPVVSFPCLMESDDGSVVFFSSKLDGVVLYKGMEGSFDIGESSKTIDFHFQDMLLFRGTLTLENV